VCDLIASTRSIVGPVQLSRSQLQSLVRYWRKRTG
jgi:hypothetical protein